MNDNSKLIGYLPELLGESLLSCDLILGEVTCGVFAGSIVEVCKTLRDNELTRCDQLIDLCGIDYISYGNEGGDPWPGERYAVVYHLMSLHHNLRIRIRAGIPESQLTIDSVINIWPAADWYEREVFDLYGIIFIGHPDLRRLLTDYGFIGHPLRKDFPLSGQVEMRYDETQGRVIYEPVTVDPRVLVPRTIRKDNPIPDR